MEEDRYGGWRSMRNGDYQEEDVWAVINESNSSTSWGSVRRDSSAASTLRRLPTAARMIPRRANSPIHEQTIAGRQSAPVGIPDWSKIYGQEDPKNTRCSSWHDDDSADDDDDEEDDDHRKVPPHEWIARKLSRNQMSSFSVCEGVGRTLKGRDLSRVRNAILTGTGFLE